MSKSIGEIFAPRPEARPRIYAYSIDDAAHKGLLKVGQTTREVTQRVAEQVKNRRHSRTIGSNSIMSPSAMTAPSSAITTCAAALAKKGFENVELEWMRCSLKDVQTVLTELRTGQRFTGTHHETFPMRAEQLDAVNKTYEYYQSIWAENKNATPRFLWNAKMRFGKTFTTYQIGEEARCPSACSLSPSSLRSRMHGRRIWKTTRISTAGSNLSRASGSDPTQVDRKQPMVYFGSFQDLLGRDRAGNIKAKNEWLHTINWDLVVFDEYHFGAWRETARELFEDDEKAIDREEALLDDEKRLKEKIADLQEPLENEASFLPITTQAYLYLSGTPFRALSTGEFIEEQIFNWTYTDEQRAKEAFAKENPGQRNHYGALPQMRLMTYQMPDELLAIASGGEFDEFDLKRVFRCIRRGCARPVQAQERRAEVVEHHSWRLRTPNH